MNKKISMALSLFALTFVLLMSSCTKDDVDDYGAINTLANIMAINASPGSHDIDVYINDVLQNGSGISYPSNSAYWQSITGLVNVKINKAGTAETIIDKDITLDQQGSYSIFVVDTLPLLSAIITTDDLSEPVLGKSHVRFAHLSPDAPSVDILDMSDSSVVFANRSFKQVSKFKPFDGGIYDLGVRAVGDSNIITLPSMQLAPGKIYTVYGTGLMNNPLSSPFGVEVILNTP